MTPMATGWSMAPIAARVRRTVRRSMRWAALSTVVAMACPTIVTAARARRLARAPVAAAEVGGLAELVTAAGDLRTLPCHLAQFGGLDGFYAARLRRTG